jgi:hypothetical protein
MDTELLMVSDAEAQLCQIFIFIGVKRGVERNALDGGIATKLKLDRLTFEHQYLCRMTQLW